MKRKPDIIDIAKNIVFFFIITAVAFGWWLLMLLIFSFVTSSFIHFTIEWIFIIAIAAAVVVDVCYVVHKIRQRGK